MNNGENNLITGNEELLSELKLLVNLGLTSYSIEELKEDFFMVLDDIELCPDRDVPFFNYKGFVRTQWLQIRN